MSKIPTNTQGFPLPIPPNTRDDYTTPSIDTRATPIRKVGSYRHTFIATGADVVVRLSGKAVYFKVCRSDPDLPDVSGGIQQGGLWDIAFDDEAFTLQIDARASLVTGRNQGLFLSGKPFSQLRVRGNTAGTMLQATAFEEPVFMAFSNNPPSDPAA